MTAKDTCLQRIQKPISDQNYFNKFRSGYWTAVQKMKSKDPAILENF